jgi:hypothetical protein
MRTTAPTDDKQLWRIADHHEGQDRSWPVYATPSQDSVGDCYLVELASPVEHSSQWQFVNGVLERVAFESDGPRWLIRHRPFEQVAIRCAGVTPEYYIRWGDTTQPVATGVPPKSPKPRKDDIDDAFIRFVCNETGLTDIPQLKLMYAMLCQYAPRWLLERHKPLRLGFCTIHAFPYRANWQATLHAKWPEILSVFRKPKRYVKGCLEATGFTESLYATDVVEMQTDATFGWTLNVTPEQAFEEAVAEVETESLHKSSSGHYVGRWSKLVSKLQGEILYAFSSWLEKASRPVASIDVTRPKDQWSLVPKRSRNRVRPSVPKPPLVRETTASFNPNDGPQVADTPDAEANEGV